MIGSISFSLYLQRRPRKSSRSSVLPPLLSERYLSHSATRAVDEAAVVVAVVVAVAVAEGVVAVVAAAEVDEVITTVKEREEMKEMKPAVPGTRENAPLSPMVDPILGFAVRLFQSSSQQRNRRPTVTHSRV